MYLYEQLPSRDQIAAAIETMVTVLDLLDGDLDREEDDPAECNADEERAAWIERVNQTRPALPAPPAHFQSHEDAEDDDPRELDDPREEDDHSGDPLDHGELGDCHGQCC